MSKKEMTKGEQIQMQQQQIAGLQEGMKQMNSHLIDLRTNGNRMAQVLDGMKLVVNSLMPILQLVYESLPPQEGAEARKPFEELREYHYQAEVQRYEEQLIKMLDKDGFVLNADGSISPKDAPPVQLEEVTEDALATEVKEDSATPSKPVLRLLDSMSLGDE